MGRPAVMRQLALLSCVLLLSGVCVQGRRLRSDHGDSSDDQEDYPSPDTPSIPEPAPPTYAPTRLMPNAKCVEDTNGVLCDVGETLVTLSGNTNSTQANTASVSYRGTLPDWGANVSTDVTTPMLINENNSCSLSKITLWCGWNTSFATTGLQLAGIVLAGGSARLTVTDSKVMLPSCSAWVELRDAICDSGALYGHALVSGSLITVVSFEGTGVSWNNVRLPLSVDCMNATSVDASRACAVNAVASGAAASASLDAVNTHAAWKAATVASKAARAAATATGTGTASAFSDSIILVMGGSVSLLRAAAAAAARTAATAGGGNASAGGWQTTISANVTIMPAPGLSLPAELDVQGVVGAAATSGSGALTLLDLVVINAPPNPPRYPLGLLTSLPWFVEFAGAAVSGSAALAKQLLMKRVRVAVPDGELTYLLAVEGRGLGISPNTSVLAGASSFAVGKAPYSRYLVYDALEATGGEWAWTDVKITAYNATPKLTTTRIVGRTKLGDLLFERASNGDMVPRPLSDAVALPTSLPLARLNIAESSSDAAPALLLLTGPTTLVLPEDGAQSVVLGSALLVGNPADAVWGQVLDVGNARPAARPDYRGFISLPPHSSGSLTLKSLTLSNIQPLGSTARRRALSSVASMVGGDGASAGGRRALASSDAVTDEDVEDALGNYSSMLWLFDVQRGHDSDGDSDNAMPMMLVDVSIVVSVVELQVLRQVLRRIPLGIPDDTYALLSSRLNKSGTNATLTAPDVSLDLLAREGLLGIVGTDVPGPIFFTYLDWFGMAWRNVTLTSVTPPGAPRAAFSSEVTLIDEGAFTSSGSPEFPEPSGDSMDTWQIAVAVVVSVCGTALLVGLGVFIYMRRRRAAKAAATSEKYAPDDSFAAGIKPGKGGNSNGGGGAKGDSGSESLGVGSGAAGRCTGAFSSSLDCSAGGTHTGSRGGSDPKAIIAAGGGGGAVGSGASGATTPTAPGSSNVAAPLPARDGTATLLERIFQSEENIDEPSPDSFASYYDAAVLGNGSDNASAPGTLLSAGEAALAAGALAGGHPGVAAATAAAATAAAAAAARNGGSGGSGGSGQTPPEEQRAAINRHLAALAQEYNVGGQAAQWTVHGTLGKGAFGVVYKGTWRGLEVAIKRVLFQVLSNTSDESHRRTALREAAINATLDHANIVPTYTYDMQPLTTGAGPGGNGVSDWQMYIIQEYCDGGSMFDAIQDGRFQDVPPSTFASASPPTGDAPTTPARPHLGVMLGFALDIASGCSYIHSKNIIHGDLKPDNVLLKSRPGGTGTGTGTGTSYIAKIADFGMSMNIRNNSHISGVKHGTPLYIAPEILRSGTASRAADVYSFGVMMWELFHGMSAWHHLMLVSAAPLKKGAKPAAFYPGLFAYKDIDCHDAAAAASAAEGGAAGAPGAKQAGGGLSDVAARAAEKCHAIDAWVALSTECLAEDPLLRPTFESVTRRLGAVREMLDVAIDTRESAPLQHRPPSLPTPAAGAGAPQQGHHPEQLGAPGTV